MICGYILRDVVADMAEDRKTDLTQEKENDTEKEIFDSLLGTLLGAAKVWDDPKLLNKVISDWLPKLMFLMLLLFAVILKLAYIRREEYYIEHLVFSLHYHAFLFLLFTLMLMLYHFAPLSHGYLAYLLWYIPLYLLVALWTVYRQGPIRRFFKAIFVSFTYIIFMSIGLTIAIGYGLTKV